jgi:hypothetical protein
VRISPYKNAGSESGQARTPETADSIGETGVSAGPSSGPVLYL